MIIRKRDILCHLLIAFLLTGCTATADRKETMPEVWTDNGTLFVQTIRQKANTIVVERGVAQSFGVNLDGACLAVTALHVVRGQDTIFLMPWSQNANGLVPSAKATVLKVDEQRDLALLKFRQKDFRCPQLKLGEEPRKLGARVHHFSQPLLNHGARFDGYLVANKWLSEQFASNILVADITTVHGSSGAVLFDDQNTALGVIVEHMDLGGKGVAKVIPIDAAYSLIEQFVKPKPTSVAE